MVSVCRVEVKLDVASGREQDILIEVLLLRIVRVLRIVVGQSRAVLIVPHETPGTEPDADLSAGHGRSRGSPPLLVGILNLRVLISTNREVRRFHQVEQSFPHRVRIDAGSGDVESSVERHANLRVVVAYGMSLQEVEPCVKEDSLYLPCDRVESFTRVSGVLPRCWTT